MQKKFPMEWRLIKKIIKKLVSTFKAAAKGLNSQKKNGIKGHNVPLYGEK